MMLNSEEMSIIEIFVKVSVCADSDELNNVGSSLLCVQFPLDQAVKAAF